MRMKLFNATSDHGTQMYIAACNHGHAAEIFVTFELAGDRQVGDFKIERCDARLTGEHQLGLEEALSWGVAGIARFDGLVGWGVSPPG